MSSSYLPKITCFTGVFLTSMWTVLTALVIAGRRKTSAKFGDGGSDLLQRRIRGHGNFVETAPFFLTLLFLAETVARAEDYNKEALIALAVLFCLGRVLHALAFMGEEYNHSCRFGGFALTILSIVAMGIVLFAFTLKASD